MCMPHEGKNFNIIDAFIVRHVWKYLAVCSMLDLDLDFEFR